MNRDSRQLGPGGRDFENQSNWTIQAVMHSGRVVRQPPSVKFRKTCELPSPTVMIIIVGGGHHEADSGDLALHLAKVAQEFSIGRRDHELGTAKHRTSNFGTAAHQGISPGYPKIPREEGIISRTIPPGRPARSS